MSKQFEKYCIEGNYDKIKEFITTFPKLVNYDDGYFFETIADHGNLDLIKLFFENGVDVNISDGYALYTCAYHKYDDCVEYLIRKGANIEKIKNTCGYENAKKIHDTMTL